jgi:hypothetical protein
MKTRLKLHGGIGSVTCFFVSIGYREMTTRNQGVTLGKPGALPGRVNTLAPGGSLRLETQLPHSYVQKENGS